jgi:adenine-specific DNA-methyltransferase
VPEALYPEIVECNEQYEEWDRLFAISEIPANLENGGEQRSIEWLKANPYLVLDTQFFDQSFKDRLLASIHNLDEKTEGLLVESENFQALNLLQARYRERVKCVYIDPPYNTGDDGFLYKDNYQHSTWLSMVRDRILLGRELIVNSGVFLASIGLEERANLLKLLENSWGKRHQIAELVWEKGRKNDSRRFSVGHDYILVWARDADALEHLMLPWREPKPGVREIIAEYERLKAVHPDDYQAMTKGLEAFYRNLPLGHPAKRYARAKNVDSRGIWRDNNISWPGGGGPRYDVIHPVTGQPCKVPRDGWRFVESTMKEKIAEGFVVFREDHTKPPFLKSYIYLDGGEVEEAENLGQKQVMGSVFYRHTQPSNDWMKDLFDEKAFENPKDHEVLGRLVRYVASKNALTMDFFAGSGSTMHAIIESNREDGGRRKYVLVEMGEYFDTVLKPRIQKVIYSKDWKDGKPVSREGTSHIFKYMRLESYEDTLNNLSLNPRTDMQDDLIESNLALREDYVLSYMLDFESKGSPSLVDLDAFEDPFFYRLQITDGDETRAENVDLVETFNYLLGLTVSHVRSADSFRTVEGTNPAGERVLVIWRNTREKSNDDLDAFFEVQEFREVGFDRIYVNGDNTLENLKAEGDGWKVALIEEEFQRLMFETAGV